MNEFNPFLKEFAVLKDAASHGDPVPEKMSPNRAGVKEARTEDKKPSQPKKQGWMLDWEQQQK
ncbi:MAG: hypothetical protein EXS51_01605 [Candidatus Taylorbacteria bacterium]|nr:hypothetical protein [Candidatus Taylorbacteria bacterium]